MGSLDAALAAVRHFLQAHDLLMVSAIIVHHIKHRQPAVRTGPQHAGRIHEITVALDRQRQASVLFVGERGAGCRGGAVTDAISAGWTRVVIVLGHVPQPLRP
jgi:hypothetical protein